MTHILVYCDVDDAHGPSSPDRYIPTIEITLPPDFDRERARRAALTIGVAVEAALQKAREK